MNVVPQRYYEVNFKEVIETLVNIGKYIGIKHQFGASSEKYCDCIGLVSLFYKDNFDFDVTDGKPIGTYEEYQRTPLRILRWLLKTMDKVDNLEFGDIIVSKVCSELHLGIYIGYGKALAMMVPCIEGVSSSTIYREEHWKPSLIQAFRRRS